jgi:hypothetical protein
MFARPFSNNILIRLPKGKGDARNRRALPNQFRKLAKL